MGTRRNLLTGALVLTGTASSLAARSAVTSAGSKATGIVYPLVAVEAASNIVPASFEYAPGDVRRYGVVANIPGAALANSAALKALWNPTVTAGPTGRFWFPNTTGADIYFLSSVIPLRDRIQIDLCGCTINYTQSVSAADANSGLFLVLRDFSCINGTITTNVNTSGATSSGYAIQLGARGKDSSYFTIWDSLLASPMGNITLRDLHIAVNNSGSNLKSTGGIGMLGGLQNVVIENVSIDGGGNASGGILYEFGWATSGTTDLRQTSHAHNLQLRNIQVTNLDTAIGIGVDLAGAYNAHVDGLYVERAASVFNATPGESLFYRPWAGVDKVGSKHAITLGNITGQSISGTALSCSGAQLASGGYLRSLIGAMGHPRDYMIETNLQEFSLDGFALDGSGSPDKGWGIFVNGATRIDIRNGSISGGFQRGIVATDECVNFKCDGVQILDCAQHGMQLDIGAAVWDPPRQKMGEIRNCFIAGNSRQRPGIYPAIGLNNCAGFLIENNRIGYEVDHDGMTEMTQGSVVQLGARCSNVICRDNHVGGVHRDSAAYYNVIGNDARGNTIQTAGGITTSRGSWDGVTVKRRIVGFGPSITFDVSGSEHFDITATSGVDFVINVPVNPVIDKTITVTVINGSGGTLGNVVWNPIFRMSPWTSPAAGHNRSIIFRFSDGHWLQLMHASVDVPN